MNKILPMLERREQQLRGLSSGIAHGGYFCAPHKRSQKLCQATIEELGKPKCTHCG